MNCKIERTEPILMKDFYTIPKMVETRANFLWITKQYDRHAELIKKNYDKGIVINLLDGRFNIQFYQQF